MFVSRATPAPVRHIIRRVCAAFDRLCNQRRGWATLCGRSYVRAKEEKKSCELRSLGLFALVKRKSAGRSRDSSGIACTRLRSGRLPVKP